MGGNIERLLRRHRVAIVLVCAFVVAAPGIFALTGSILLTAFWAFLVAATVVFARW